MKLQEIMIRDVVQISPPILLARLRIACFSFGPGDLFGPENNRGFLARRGRCLAARHAHDDRRDGSQLARNPKIGLDLGDIQRRDRGADDAGAESHRAGSKHQVLRCQPAIGDDERPHGLAANDDKRARIIEDIEIRARKDVERVAAPVEMGTVHFLEEKRFCTIREAL